MVSTFKYKGRSFPIMTLNEAVREFEAQQLGGKPVYIVQTLPHGGKPNDYIVVEAKYGRLKQA